MYIKEGRFIKTTSELASVTVTFTRDELRDLIVDLENASMKLRSIELLKALVEVINDKPVL